MRLANIDEWTEDQIYERLGAPQRQEVDHSATNLPASESSFPDYTVHPINMKEVSPFWLDYKIIIIDFGIAFFQNTSSHNFGTPKNYCAPEFLFGLSRSVASDIWALGCTIFEIRTGCRLFTYTTNNPSRDDILITLVQLLGSLPNKWATWNGGLDWYNTQSKIAIGSTGTILEQIMETGAHDGDDPIYKGLAYIENQKRHSINSIPTTDQLVAMAEGLGTSDARDVLRMFRAFEQGLSSTGFNGKSKHPASGSSLYPKNSHNESSGGKISEGKVSDAKSSEKTSSSEGISIGHTKKKIVPDVHIIPEDTQSKDAIQPTDDESVQMQEASGPSQVELSCGPEHSQTFLEPAGFRITFNEAETLENLLRMTLQYLPEERPTTAELSTHAWFSDVSL